MIPDDYDIETLHNPSMFFIGVTTGQSTINRLFPLWKDILGLEKAQLVGVDLPLNAPPWDYREAVAQIKYDSQSLGGLVTSHKLDLMKAAQDMFDELGRYARLCGEISSISTREGRLIGKAKDPITSGKSMNDIVGEGYWHETGADVMCIGAGGAGVAITASLTIRQPEDDRPKRLLLIDIDPDRLDHLRGIAAELPPHQVELEFIQNESAEHNDRLMESLPPGSMVINATGMGKDRPGSPITDAGQFPFDGIAWELNYRGERLFLQQAQAQSEERELIVEDGWYYFLIGWAAIIEEVFDLTISQPLFEEMARAAETIR